MSDVVKNDYFFTRYHFLGAIDQLWEGDLTGAELEEQVPICLLQRIQKHLEHVVFAFFEIAQLHAFTVGKV